MAKMKIRNITYEFCSRTFQRYRRYLAVRARPGERPLTTPSRPRRRYSLGVHGSGRSAATILARSSGGPPGGSRPDEVGYRCSIRQLGRQRSGCHWREPADSHITRMPHHLDLTDDQAATLLRELDAIIREDRYFLSPRIQACCAANRMRR